MTSRVAGHGQGREVAGRPPDTKPHRPAGGSPARSASTRRAWFSAATAPAASNHVEPWSDEQETIMSKSIEARVGAAGMKARNRGLSHEMTAGARWSAKI